MMRYIPTDKYTVAWFKLAECVAKGEKEKAFGVYRLLMHSLEDKAYAHQLEGDLLGAFHDERALEKYEHAAQLYVINHRPKEAIALYEELVLMNLDNARAMHCLLELYNKHKKPEQYAPKIIRLAQLFIAKKNLSPIERLIDMLPSCTASDETAKSSIELCTQIVQKEEAESHVIEKVVQKTALYVTSQVNTHLLEQLLSELKQINSHWYQCARDYITSNGPK
jgi:hypothetical protein